MTKQRTKQDLLEWNLLDTIVRGRVFREKRKLKGTRKNITENLTTKRIGQLNVERENYGFNNVWSCDGKILYKTNNEVKVYYD